MYLRYHSKPYRNFTYPSMVNYSPPAILSEQYRIALSPDKVISRCRPVGFLSSPQYGGIGVVELNGRTVGRPVSPPAGATLRVRPSCRSLRAQTLFQVFFFFLFLKFVLRNDGNKNVAIIPYPKMTKGATLLLRTFANNEFKFIK